MVTLYFLLFCLLFEAIYVTQLARDAF